MFNKRKKFDLMKELFQTQHEINQMNLTVDELTRKRIDRVIERIKAIEKYLGIEFKETPEQTTERKVEYVKSNKKK